MTVPSCRTLTIEAEDRTLTVEGSTYTSDTTLPIYGVTIYGAMRYGVNETPSERSLTIVSETRTLTVECD